MSGNGYRMKWLAKHTYQLEHRWVVEQRLGRMLQRNEQVHHVNGNKLDNRPENLVVMTPIEHARLHHVGKIVSQETRHRLKLANRWRRARRLAHSANGAWRT